MARHILKKGLWILIICLTASLIGNSVYAEENEMKPIKLKRKCLKQHTLAENQTDQALLVIYQQACDKDNASRANELLAQAAMRMYELKQPMNALKLVTQLQSQNVRGTTLTDVAFLASVDIANSSLEQMRSNEMRFLSSDLTYPPAKKLSDRIRSSLPAPETDSAKGITDESVKRELRNTSNNHTTRRTINKKFRSNQRNTATQTVAPVKRQAAITPVVAKQQNTVQKAGSNPFDSLK